LAKIANSLLKKDLISIGSCGSILYREFEFTSLRQRVLLSLILELFSLQIRAFGREITDFASTRESLSTDQLLHETSFSLLARVEVRFFVRSFSGVRDLAILPFSPLRTCH
jgi:hypothetical protein